MDNYTIRLNNLRALEKQEASRTRLAEKLDIPYAQLSHYIGKNPSKNIGIKTARQVEQVFNLPHGWMDIEHIEAIEKVPSLTKVLEWQNKEDLTDFVYIKYVSCKLSAGTGELVYGETEKTPRAMHKSWLLEKGVKAEDLVAFKISGWSMSPYIEDGDIVMINTNTNGLCIVDNAAYAIRYGDELRVKRLVRRFDGSVVIKSDNPDKGVYPDETLNAESAADLVVLGKVVWRGG
jgi:phage repressor protein C with HTH and peptisase S24 domain